jgi:hypothetical protein
VKVDFETLAAIISFLTSAAGVGGLIALLADTDFRELQKELGGLIKTERADYKYTKRKTQNVGWRLFTGITILHLVNIGVYIVLLLVLIIGPERLPAALLADTAAEPLAPLEKILYSTWLVISILVYLFRCILPTLDSFVLYGRAKSWLKDNKEDG